MLDTYGDISSPALVFLHGFLGSKEDWLPIIELLQEQFFCVALDLDVPAVIQETLKALCLLHPILIGYSMGGRVALQLPIDIPKVVMSAHIGLATQAEKEMRWEADLKWIELLEKEPIEVFLDKWYAQPLFASLRRRKELFEQLIHRRKQLDPKQLIAQLKQMSLAQQERIVEFDSSVVFLFGEEDWKYEQLYCTLPEQVQRKKILKAGHAIHLENPEECAQIIKQWSFCHAYT